MRVTKNLGKLHHFVEVTLFETSAESADKDSDTRATTRWPYFCLSVLEELGAQPVTDFLVKPDQLAVDRLSHAAASLSDQKVQLGQKR